MNDLYVYYRVRNEAAPALQAEVLAMQAALAAATGVRTGLKRRPEEKNGEQTWMEIYEATPPGFTDALDAAVDAAGLAARIAGARHVEIFTDIAPCA